MTRRSALAGLARLSSLLVREHDPLGVITVGLSEACASVSAQAGGVLVQGADHDLEVLTATSHRAADLETYQASTQTGPCVECIEQHRAVSVSSPAAANNRWPGLGDRMTTAGFHRARAIPMSWQGVCLGGLNIFWTEPGELPEVDEVMLQMFADILTLAVVHVHPVPTGDALGRLETALEARSWIEQAKGVLAYQRDLDMGGAFAALLEVAEREQLTLGAAARSVVERARQGEEV